MGDLMRKILALSVIGKWAGQKEQANVPGLDKLRIHRPDEDGADPDAPNIELPIERCGCKGLYVMLRLEEEGRIPTNRLNWMDELS